MVKITFLLITHDFAGSGQAVSFEVCDCTRTPPRTTLSCTTKATIFNFKDYR